jgi:uncharacterized protein (TIGR03435 family)
MRPLTLILSVAIASYAQPSAFEVASVKPNTAGGRMSVESSGDRFRAIGIGLGPLVLMAYDLNVRQISGLDHTFDDRYDIAAKADHRVGSSEMRQMLQSLLADRFKLQLHWETRDVPVYSLTVTKGGPKLRHSETPEDDIPRVRAPASAGGTETPSGVIYTHESMGDFAWALSRMARIGDRQVVDNTGLEGHYDFTLMFDRNPTPSVGTDTPLSLGPDIFAALKEQLGLKLELAKAPVRLLVIDHVERPSAN